MSDQQCGESAGSERLGFIGLGRMGAPIARRLAERSTGLAVFDLDAGRVAELAAVGALAGKSPTEIARTCDIVFTCLPTSNEVEDVLFGVDGMATSRGRVAIVVDMTSGDPRETRMMAQRASREGITLVDAPVSGGPLAVSNETLTIMVGASEQAYRAIEPILLRVGRKVVHVGETGAGHTLKCLNNTMMAANRLIAFEAAAAAANQGIDAAQFIDVINGSSGRNSATQLTFPNHILSGTLEQGFSLGLLIKDVETGATLMADSDDLSVSRAVLDVLHNAAGRLGSNVDVNGLLRLYEAAMSTRVASEGRHTV